MAHIKGKNFNNLCAYIVEHEGEAVYTSLLQHLPEEDRRRCEAIVANDDWFDVHTYFRLFRRYIDQCHQGNPKAAMLPPLRLIERNMKTIHKVFLKLGQPSFTVKMASILFRKYYDEGRLHVVASGPTFVRGELIDFPVKDPVACHSILGGLVGGLRATGVRNIRAEQSACAALGAPACLVELTWELARDRMVGESDDRAEDTIYGGHHRPPVQLL